MQRFLSLDPLAADFASWSPYNYVLGNPVILVDPSGRSPEEYTYYVDGQKVEGGAEKSMWNKQIGIYQKANYYKSIIKAARKVIAQMGTVQGEIDFRNEYFYSGQTKGYRPRGKTKRVGGALEQLSEIERNIAFKPKEVNISSQGSPYYIGDIRNSVIIGEEMGNQEVSSKYGSFTLVDAGVWTQAKDNVVTDMFFDEKSPRVLMGGSQGTAYYGRGYGYHLHSGFRGAGPPSFYLTFKTDAGRNQFYESSFNSGHTKAMKYLKGKYLKSP